MTAHPWIKWFPQDWLGEPSLRVCSLAARGLWIDLLCIAADTDPTGYVTVNGTSPTTTDLARLTGAPEADVESLLAELERNGVFSRDRKDRIYSRRMVRDAKRAKKARQNGQKGGNPSLSKQSGIPPPDNPPVKAGVKPQKPEARNQRESSPESQRSGPGPAPDDGRQADRAGGRAGAGNVVALAPPGKPRGWDPDGMAEIVAEQFLALHRAHWPDLDEMRLNMPRLTLKADVQGWIERGLGHEEFYSAFDGAMARMVKAGKGAPRSVRAFRLTLEDAAVKMERQA